jgi:hypothetical protein
VDILGFEHKTDLYEGLKLMWDWARVQPERPRQVWGTYEVEQGIYPFWKTDVLVGEAKTALLKN